MTPNTQAEALAAGPGMTAPLRIQLSRRKGFRLPENTVFVARPTVFGNPWTVRHAREAGYPGTDEQLSAWCVRLYREWVTRDPRSMTRMLNDGKSDLEALERRLPELRGKNLACWCKPSAPCHADVLLDLANREPTDA